MKETSIYDYYSFGYNYRLWQGDWSKKTNTAAINDLEDYLGNVSSLELQVTSQVVSDLRTTVEELRQLKPTDVITASSAAEILKLINGADQTLDAELQLKKVMSITPKRFDVEMLLRSPSGLLSSGCWVAMSETAKRDFSEATRCIAMHLATASAFHLMRCVEECLKLLYFSFVKQGRMKKPMWGPMVEKLRDKNNPRPSKELLDQLDIIRANFRNPTQHPEKFYTLDEAQDLLNSSIVAIGAICRELARHKVA